MALVSSVHATKTHLSRLLKKVSAGEQIVITNRGKPVALLSPMHNQPTSKRIPGIDKGKIWMSPDFDMLSERELEDWYRPDRKLY
jgi:prevent-host-death family protein